VVISVLATTQVAIIGTSRLLFSMSRDKVLPKRLGVIHERYRTPAFTTLILGALVIIFGSSTSTSHRWRRPSVTW